MVYAQKGEQPGYYYPQDLAVGDSLFSRGSKVPIARIETTFLPGSAAPLTLSGTAYIDRVLTSNYVGVSSHSLAHLALPERCSVFDTTL